jgi:hypothetical protein
MAATERITIRELDRFKVIQDVRDGKLKPWRAAERLGLTSIEMARSRSRQEIPTKLTAAQSEQFALPHLSKGGRDPAKKLSFHPNFNYFLRLLYLGRPWNALPIESDSQGLPEIHQTRIYRADLAPEKRIPC